MVRGILGRFRVLWGGWGYTWEVGGTLLRLRVLWGDWGTLGRLGVLGEVEGTLGRSGNFEKIYSTLGRLRVLWGELSYSGEAVDYFWKIHPQLNYHLSSISISCELKVI